MATGLSARRCAASSADSAPPVRTWLSICCVLAAVATLSAAGPAARHLRVEGRHFVTPEGAPFQWRGITAFRLVDFVADGREDRARSFLSWTRAQHLTVVRVFAMLHGFFDLAPEHGRAALPRVLELAAAHGLHVEIVGLTGTADATVDPRKQIAELGRIAANHGNALLEVANEPYHPTQSADVHRPEFVAELAKLVPSDVPAALGSIETDRRFGEGAYATWHAPRGSGDAGWQHVVAIADGAAFSERLGKPVISDEPIGAGPRFEPGRRDNAPERFRAAGLLTRLAGLGATFHYEGGLQAIVPQGPELECFVAWNEAWDLLPDDIERRGTFYRAGDAGAAVRAFDPAGALAVFERHDGSRAWILVIRPTSSPALRWADGWSSISIKQAPGIELVLARRRPA
jgi:hypothetical protein